MGILLIASPPGSSDCLVWCNYAHVFDRVQRLTDQFLSGDVAGFVVSFHAASIKETVVVSLPRITRAMVVKNIPIIQFGSQ